MKDVAEMVLLVPGDGSVLVILNSTLGSTALMGVKVLLRALRALLLLLAYIYW